MDLKSRLESHPISTLKKEISKTNIKGYSKMKKNEVVSLMLKNKDRFNHIQKKIDSDFTYLSNRIQNYKEGKGGNFKKLDSLIDDKDLDMKASQRRILDQRLSKIEEEKKRKEGTDKKKKFLIQQKKKGGKVVSSTKTEIHPEGIHIHINWKDGNPQTKTYDTKKLGENAFKKIRSERKEKRDYKSMKLMDGLKILDYSA